MKYTTEIIIDLPLSKVIAIFENPELLPDWQRGLKYSKLIKGENGEVGAKRKLKVDLEIKTIIMIETIIKKKLPNEWHGKYSANGIDSIQKNYFKAINENQTHWKNESEFKFHGAMRIISKIMPGIFKQRGEQVMTDFKAFAEREVSQRKK
ncbi:SRPBCC family protein [Psychroflexus maritimus]|uniref:SRPBCC family protein n=1 Tax=Psychroflexus maritimus TaxID=2714865 RepID=A0A967AHV7_9FLAO|nr:SRPBCC family protein [Psychroflexus maritimus]NGZ88649.1 SRPBCC family protein [Psychroflexus maritimus]